MVRDKNIQNKGLTDMPVGLSKLIDEIVKADINLTIDEIKLLRNSIVELYIKENKMDRHEAEEKASKVMFDAIQLWPHAPKEYKKRVDMKIGNHKLQRKKKEKQRKKLERLLEPQYGEHGELLEAPKIVDLFSPEDLEGRELLYYEARKKKYQEEFEFNDSSDRMILEQILFYEIMQHRSRSAMLKGNIESVHFTKNESELSREYREALSKLGILREQRITLDRNIQGNVSQLSVELDKKLKQINELENPELKRKSIEDAMEGISGITYEEVQDYVDEAILQMQHELRGELNPIPQVVSEEIKGRVEAGG